MGSFQSLLTQRIEGQRLGAGPWLGGSGRVTHQLRHAEGRRRRWGSIGHSLEVQAGGGAAVVVASVAGAVVEFVVVGGVGGGGDGERMVGGGCG